MYRKNHIQVAATNIRSFAPFYDITHKYNTLKNPALAQDTDSRPKDKLYANQFSCSTIHIQSS